MESSEFKKELVNIMPGYHWTVHRKKILDSNYLSATGIQSAGNNRLSTLYIIRREKENDRIEYEVKSSGFGKDSPWLYEVTDGTLARALRRLQNHYEHMASEYSGHALALQNARKNKD